MCSAPVPSAAIWLTRLAASGADVSVVARGEHLAAIRANGLTLEMPKETVKARVNASAEPRDLGPQDLVLVCVKAPALPEVAAGIAPLLKPDNAGDVCHERHSVVVLLQAWRAARRAAPAAHRSGRCGVERGRTRNAPSVASSTSSNSVVRPGVIRNTSGRAHLVIGEPSGEMTPRIQKIADVDQRQHGNSGGQHAHSR